MCRRETIPFAEARATVLGAYGLFSPEMADIARRFFDERWIDAPVRPGKSPGAFAHPTVPSRRTPTCSSTIRASRAT